MARHCSHPFYSVFVGVIYGESYWVMLIGGRLTFVPPSASLCDSQSFLTELVEVGEHKWLEQMSTMDSFEEKKTLLAKVSRCFCFSQGWFCFCSCRH